MKRWLFSTCGNIKIIKLHSINGSLLHGLIGIKGDVLTWRILVGLLFLTSKANFPVNALKHVARVTSFEGGQILGNKMDYYVESFVELNNGFIITLFST